MNSVQQANARLTPDDVEANTSKLIIKFKNGRARKRFIRNFEAAQEEDFSRVETANNFVSLKLHNKNFKLQKAAPELNFSRLQNNGKVLRNSKKARNLRKKLGLNQTYTLDIPEGANAKEVINELSNSNRIEYVEPALSVQTFADFNDPFWDDSEKEWTLSYSEMWGPRKIKADEVWNTTQGDDVVVAVVDSGVDYNHPDLWDNIWLDPNLVTDTNGDGKLTLDDVDANGDKIISNSEIIPDMFGKDIFSNDKDPMDGNGHGTHVAGTIAAVANNGIGLVGVAPKARIMAVRALGDDGRATDASLGNAVIYAADHGADIINASWGGRGNSRFVSDAFDYANQLGVTSIAAAGNDNQNADFYFPAALDSVLTVGASTFVDSRASFSNWGNSVDIAAPGGGVGSDAPDGTGTENILSTISTDTTIARQAGYFRVGEIENGRYGYYRIKGTSMAAPHVAGAAALVKAARPELSNFEIIEVLKDTADPINTDRTIGNRRVNAYRAASFNQVLPLAKLDIIVNEETRNGHAKGLIDFTGTARAENLTSYKIEYQKSGENTWTTIKTDTQPVNNTFFLEDFDTNSVLDGLYTFRLIVEVEDAANLVDSEQLHISNDGGQNITSCAQLQEIKNNLSGEYRLSANVDCSASAGWNAGAGFEPLGTNTNPFTGAFNGNGFQILNLTINRETRDDVALFGGTREALIENLALTNVNIKGRIFTGSLVGYTGRGTEIKKCLTTGEIESTGSGVGGLVGGAENSAAISDSYSEANVTGVGFVGGAAGYLFSDSRLNRVYATGTINASVNFGGVVGGAQAAQIRNCYWDTETSGLQTSAYGTGLSTANMQKRNSFNTWDFRNVWSINQNQDYPKLRAMTFTPPAENNAPTDITLAPANIPENNSLGALVGTLTTTDSDEGDEHVYRILAVDGNPNNGLFTINGDEVLAAGRVDYETATSHTITVSSTDFFGASLEKDITIQVENVIEDAERDDDILLTSVTVAENSNPGTVIARIDNIHESLGKTYRYELQSTQRRFVGKFLDPATKYFRIRGNRLIVKSPPNYEMYKNVTIRIKSIDQDGNSLIKDFRISILNAADQIAITNCQGLQNMMDNLEGDYYLANDIDCEETEDWNDDAGFLPIGGARTVLDDEGNEQIDSFSLFKGTLDGRFYNIKNLYIRDEDGTSSGLFGYIYGGAVRNLALEDVRISGTNLVGAIAGLTSIDSKIENVHVLNGGVSGRNYVGGLVGLFNYSTMSESSVRNLNVTSQKRAGGLVGASQIYSSISDSYSTGRVRATSFAGGITGRNTLFTEIKNCYSAAVVEASADFGGVVGFDEETGDVFETVSLATNFSDIERNPRVINSYWDTQSSGVSVSEGGNGMTTSQLQSQATYTGWDFNDIWSIADNSYPNFKLDPVTYTLPSDGSDPNPPDQDEDGVPDDQDDDQDGDGVPDEEDNDQDGDGIPNEEDDDQDGDGIPNEEDNDQDGDGIPNEQDDDQDGDGVPDNQDDDQDGDGIPNEEDDDQDGDGIPNEEDDDQDGDGIPNEDDLNPDNDPDDLDGDGIPNDEDDDQDGDGIPNNEDDDQDGDGVPNDEEDAGNMPGDDQDNDGGQDEDDNNDDGNDGGANPGDDQDEEDDNSEEPGDGNDNNGGDGDEPNDDEGTEPSRDEHNPVDNGEGVFLVGNCFELQNIRVKLAESYELLNDIDCTGTLSWDSAKGFEPIGNSEEPFTGTVDGKGYTVAGLYLNRNANNQAMFGNLKDATIRNINFDSPKVTGRNNVAVVAAYGKGATLENIGIVNANIESDKKFAAGLVGEAENTTVISAKVDLEINGNRNIGGIAGKFTTGTVDKSYSYGIITGNRFVGGLLGHNTSSTISNSYSEGILIATEHLGGLIGFQKNPVQISDSYAASTINGGGAGGLFGSSNNAADSAITNSYWDKDVSGVIGSAYGGEGKTTDEMSEQAQFEGWDFNSTWNIDEGLDYPRLRNEAAKEIAFLEEDDSVEPTPDGNFFNINNCVQLQAIKNNLRANYRLTRNINCSQTEEWNDGAGFEPIGTLDQPFVGRFEGDFFTINGLTINRPNSNSVAMFAAVNRANFNNFRVSAPKITGNSSVALIASEAKNSRFSQISVADSKITASGNTAGGLVAKASNTKFIKIALSEDVTASSNLGGIVGEAEQVKIARSYVNAQAFANVSNVGGLIGSNFGSSNIKDSYVLGRVASGNSVAGGLVGLSDGSLRLSNSYTNAIVKTNNDIGGLVAKSSDPDGIQVFSSYWNEFAASTIDSVGGGGARSEAQLQQQNNYRGWDFETIWDLGSSTPVLR
jgi:hypothetical protein